MTAKEKTARAVVEILNRFKCLEMVSEDLKMAQLETQFQVCFSFKWVFWVLF